MAEAVALMLGSTTCWNVDISRPNITKLSAWISIKVTNTTIRESLKIPKRKKGTVVIKANAGMRAKTLLSISPNLSPSTAPNQIPAIPPTNKIAP